MENPKATFIPQQTSVPFHCTYHSTACFDDHEATPLLKITLLHWMPGQGLKSVRESQIPLCASSTALCSITGWSVPKPVVKVLISGELVVTEQFHTCASFSKMCVTAKCYMALAVTVQLYKQQCTDNTGSEGSPGSTHMNTYSVGLVFLKLPLRLQQWSSSVIEGDPHQSP